MLPKYGCLSARSRVRCLCRPGKTQHLLPKSVFDRPGSDRRWNLASTTFPDAEPMVRIHLPPAESLSLSRSCFRGSRTSAFRAAVRGGLATGSAETRRVLQDSANRRQYLCRVIFQYRSAADGVDENATPVPIKSGRSPSLIVRWIVALGPGSTKAQHDPLIVPGKRQA